MPDAAPADRSDGDVRVLPASTVRMTVSFAGSLLLAVVGVGVAVAGHPLALIGTVFFAFTAYVYGQWRRVPPTLELTPTSFSLVYPGTRPGRRGGLRYLGAEVFAPERVTWEWRQCRKFTVSVFGGRITAVRAERSVPLISVPPWFAPNGRALRDLLNRYRERAHEQS